MSEVELEYHRKHVLSAEALEGQALLCTSCFKSIDLERGVVVRHPELGVPICKNCKKFYHLGEWTRQFENIHMAFFLLVVWC